jgi:hypothetical protein
VTPARFGRQFESPPVDRHEFIRFVVKAVPREANIGMWNHNAIESGIVKLPPMRALRESFAVAPIPIHGEDNSPVATSCCCGAASQSARCKSRARDHRAGRFQKIASIHGFPFPVEYSKKRADQFVARILTG